jgi:SM-20-related protein
MDDSVHDPIILLNWDQLSEKGWLAGAGLFTQDYLIGLHQELTGLWSEGRFREAGIGSGSDQMLRSEIRNDHIFWLDPANLSPIQFLYWKKIDQLRQELNRRFFFGLEDFEAHFAVYPPGSFYKKHLDRFRSRDERVISCVLFLNFAWDPAYGGQLRIYTDPGVYRDIQPDAGTFVCFLSDQIYHEVLPCTATRYSLSGWLRRKTYSVFQIKY